MVSYEGRVTILDKVQIGTERAAPRQPLSSRGKPLRLAIETIKRLNKEGYTKIFIPRPFSQQESLALVDCRWTMIGLHPLMHRAGSKPIAYLENPDASEEGRVVCRDGSVVKGSFLLFHVVPLERISDPRHTPRHDATVGTTMAEDDRVITKGGARYYPVSLAAQVAQVPRQTLHNWIKNKTKFDGQSLQIYNSPTAGKFFLSEESVQRMSNRFVKWPSNQPAGRVTIGKTDDQTGFLGLPDAARIIGISPRTMWLWATQKGKAPMEKPPHVIKCTTSDHFYIRESDVFALKGLVPRSGLPRGPRTQPALQL